MTNYPSLEQILHKEGPKFVDNIVGILNNAPFEIDTSAMMVDHVCFRTCSQAEYEHRKRELLGMGELLIESIVGGRLIATFKIADPIVTHAARRIDVIELPSPKSGSSYDSGLEHCEFVIAESLEDFVSFSSLI